MTNPPASALHSAPAPHEIADVISQGPRPRSVPRSLALAAVLAAMLVKDLVS
jgi:hypothetical protein